jgi:hypothetical protein
MTTVYLPILFMPNDIQMAKTSFRKIIQDDKFRIPKSAATDHHIKCPELAETKSTVEYNF